MPRDGSGVYTLPVGNPVITNTTIDSTWANPTMNDIAAQLNNVLTRDGLLGPIGPFKIVDGSVLAPGIAFNSEVGSGWYRNVANTLSMANGGKEVNRWTLSNAAQTVQQIYPRSDAGGAVLVLNNMGGAIPNGGQARLWVSAAEGVLDTVAVGTGARPPLRIDAATVTAQGNWTFSGQVTIPNAVFTGNAESALAVRSGASAVGARIIFNWAGLGGQPTWVFGGGDPSAINVYNPSNFSVNYAQSAGYANSAGSAPANGGTAQNSNQVNGIGGWAYTNHGNNPAYLWATEGDGQAQHLTTPGALSVNYANTSNRANTAGYADSAGSAPANGGTSTNSNQLGGQGPDYYINGGGSAARNLRNNGIIQMISGIAGTGDLYWGANLSDARLKENVVPSERNSLADIAALRFVGYNFRSDVIGAIGDGSFHPVGVLAQEAEEINPKWISHAGTWLQPDVYEMLMSTMHAVQQLYRMMK